MCSGGRGPERPARHSPGKAVPESVVIGEPGHHAHRVGHEAASHAPAQPGWLPVCLAVVETVLALEKQQQRPVTSRPTWKSTLPVFKSISISRRKRGFRGRTESTLSKTGAMLSFHRQAGVSTGLATHFAGPTGCLLHRGAEVTKRGKVRPCPGEAGRFEREGMQLQHSGTQKGPQGSD